MYATVPKDTERMRTPLTAEGFEGTSPVQISQVPDLMCYLLLCLPASLCPLGRPYGLNIQSDIK
jgi:hypothetical protein